MISNEAVEAGLAAWADRKAVWPKDVVRHILEAAAPHLMAGWESIRKSEAETQKEPKVIPVPRSAVTNLYKRRQ